MKYEQIKNLQEFENVHIEQCNLSKVDNVDFDSVVLEDEIAINQILSVDPETGFPRNDIEVLETTNNLEIRDYLLRCLRKISPVPNHGLSEEDLDKLRFSKFDTADSYIKRLEQFVNEIDTNYEKDSN